MFTKCETAFCFHLSAYLLVPQQLNSEAKSDMANTYANIGLQGHSVGTASLKEDRVEWKDRSNQPQEFLASAIKKISWNIYGQRGYLRLDLASGDWTRLDGFAKSDYDGISAFVNKHYNQVLEKELVSSEGASYGDIELRDNTIVMNSLVKGTSIFELKIDNAAQCVVPQMQRNDLELQFHENTNPLLDKEEEALVSCTLHFPPPEVGEDGVPEEETPAQRFQQQIMKTGWIKSTKGDVICEFSKELGAFVSPRGKYGMQLTSTYLHMQGAQYTYKIKYSDITSLFLLDKPDGLRVAFVICLAVPIRQGMQKYQNLVLETHKLEHTVSLNLTQEEIDENESYRGNLQPTMTLAMASCIAKLFKVLSETPVYVPKSFKSFRDDFCVRCSHKTNDGLLYPLAKSMIFINKPTVITSYEDIEFVEFQRYIPTANSATKNFDINIGIKPSASRTEASYLFTSIDRAEYNFLFDFFESKKLNILNPMKGLPESKRGAAAGAFAGMDMEDGGGEEDSEDDGDYNVGESDKSENDSDDSGSESEGDEEGGEPKVKKEKVKREKKEGGEKKERRPKGSPKAKVAKGEKVKKAKKKKDPNAPKAAVSGYFFYAASDQGRKAINAEQPDTKMTEVAKLLGVRWKAMLPEEQAPYQEQARADKERYAQELKAYNAKRAAEGADLDSGSDDDMAIVDEE